MTRAVATATRRRRQRLGEPVFRCGEPVRVRWDDGQWYDAIVRGTSEAVTNGRYDVDFVDTDEFAQRIPARRMESRAPADWEPPSDPVKAEESEDDATAGCTTVKSEGDVSTVRASNTARRRAVAQRKRRKVSHKAKEPVQHEGLEEATIERRAERVLPDLIASRLGTKNEETVAAVADDELSVVHSADFPDDNAIAGLVSRGNGTNNQTEEPNLTKVERAVFPNTMNSPQSTTSNADEAENRRGEKKTPPLEQGMPAAQSNVMFGRRNEQYSNRPGSPAAVERSLSPINVTSTTACTDSRAGDSATNISDWVAGIIKANSNAKVESESPQVVFTSALSSPAEQVVDGHSDKSSDVSRMKKESCCNLTSAGEKTREEKSSSKCHGKSLPASDTSISAAHVSEGSSLNFFHTSACTDADIAPIPESQSGSSSSTSCPKQPPRPGCMGEASSDSIPVRTTSTGDANHTSTATTAAASPTAENTVIPDRAISSNRVDAAVKIKLEEVESAYARARDPGLVSEERDRRRALRRRFLIDPATGKGRRVFRRGCHPRCVTTVLGGSGMHPFPILSREPPEINGTKNPFIRRGEFYFAGRGDWNPWTPLFPGDSGLLEAHHMEDEDRMKQEEFHCFQHCPKRRDHMGYLGRDAAGGRLYLGKYRRVPVDAAAEVQEVSRSFLYSQLGEESKYIMADTFRKYRKDLKDVLLDRHREEARFLAGRRWDSMKEERRETEVWIQLLLDIEYRIEIVPVEFVSYDEELYQELCRAEADNGMVSVDENELGPL